MVISGGSTLPAWSLPPSSPVLPDRLGWIVLTPWPRLVGSSSITA